jgi:hypothetical protein
MEQTGSFEFWLSALVGGGVVAVVAWIKSKWNPLPMTLWLFAAVMTAAAVVPLCLIFGKPLTPDAVTTHTSLAMMTYGGLAALREHGAEKAARAISVDSSGTNVTGG